MSLVNGKWTGPIVDNHFHLNRKGLFLSAAEDFKNAGGTGIVLVHCPDFSSLQQHLKAIEILILIQY